MIETIPSFLSQDATSVAQKLLGCTLVRTLDHQTIRATIVETESYDQSDAASHSYTGQTARTEVMFGEAGRLYVYFTYGMHYCCNVVTGKLGEGSAVLIRAVEPELQYKSITTRRKIVGPAATNGPAKLCQALGIDKTLNGHDLRSPPLQLRSGNKIEASDIVATSRIGISKAKDSQRRFFIKNNIYVSRATHIT